MHRSALIGYGHMGKHHAELLAWLPETELVAVCDTRPDSLAEARDTYPGVATYTDVAALLEREQPDLVVIATHAGFHAAPALLAAAHGAHVLCEKPIAANLEEADRMVDAFAERGLVLAVNHQWRLGPAVERAAELLRSGAIGALVSIHLSFGKGRPAGYELAEMGTHVFDLVNRFAGQPTSCQAHVVHEDRPAEPADVMNGDELLPGGRDCGLVAGTSISASFQYQSGLLVSAEAYAAGSKTVKTRIAVELRGTKARLRLSSGDFSRLALSEGVYPAPGADTLEWKEVSVPQPPTVAALSARANTMLRLYQSFLASVKTGTPHPCSGADARQALEMISAVYQSHFKRSPVSLPLRERGDYLRDLAAAAAATGSEG